MRAPAILTRLLIATAMLIGLGAAAVVAAEEVPPLTTSPTATPLAEDAPLGEAYREAFVGEDGVYDPERGIVTPDEVAFDVEVQAAHDGEQVFLRYEFPTPLPAFYHDYLVYQDGEWHRAGRSPVGPEPHGLYEDRLTMLLDDGSVKGFANQGGWLTCHDDLREPFMYGAEPHQGEQVEAHPVLGEVYGEDDVRKYLPQSRDTGPDWFGQFDGWDAMSPERVDEYEQRREAGVFLDLWHWRAHRSEPVGYSDSQHVFQHRDGDSGDAPYVNQSDDPPEYMLDPERTPTGRPALDWDTVQEMGYAWDDEEFYATIDDVVDYDPDYDWQDGDVIPRRLLDPEPEGSRVMITADSELVEDGEGWRWEIELTRPLDTGYPTEDKILEPGRTYDAAVAVHRLATGSRWHFVTMPFSIGIGVPGDVTAPLVEGDGPDWDEIDSTTLTAMYPGQTSWQRVSERHPGGAEMRADTMSVVGCHDDEVGLASAMRSMEPEWAGVDAHVEEPDTLAAVVFDPQNAVIVFTVIALGTVVGAVVIARRRGRTDGDQGREQEVTS